MILHGDCLEEMRKMDACSVDAIVTDPPYGLSFMGKKWDYDVPSVEIWREAMRVLKPGGHLLAFGGTRTYHRLAVNIEDAGFEIRDQIMWLYGSGFPKSMDVSKAIDKAAGAEREILGVSPNDRPKSQVKGGKAFDRSLDDGQEHEPLMLTGPSTAAAKQWQGWGTNLKPANEPIVVARKPLEKGLTVAANVQKYGTGALNIDASRVEAADQAVLDAAVKRMTGNAVTKANSKNFLEGQKSIEPVSAQGRWPANLILNEEAAACLDAQSGHLHAPGSSGGGKTFGSKTDQQAVASKTASYKDAGGASRFFYCAKASKRERNAGLDTPSSHPCVKPIALMEYLIRLVTPPNGTVLDPFAGSGSTLVAAQKLNFKFIGIELDADYHQIATKRVEAL